MDFTRTRCFAVDQRRQTDQGECRDTPSAFKDTSADFVPSTSGSASEDEVEKQKLEEVLRHSEELAAARREQAVDTTDRGNTPEPSTPKPLPPVKTDDLID